MKGLILKDLYMTAKYFRNYVLILLLFLVVSFVQTDNLFFSFYPFMICGMIPVNLLAFDERGHWDIYCGTLPVTRDMVVSCKYLIGLIAQGSIFLISAIAQAVRIGISGPFDWSSYGLILSMMWIVSLVSSSITLPFMFKLGVEKGRMAYYVMIGVLFGGAAAFSNLYANSLQSTMHFSIALILGVIAAAAVYGLSWYLSIRFYRSRELY